MTITQAVRAAYTSWSAEGVQEAVAGAEKLLQRHRSIEEAQAAISELAYGNVSLSCRATFRPIDNVLTVMKGLNQ